MVWEFIFMMVILKIPIVYLCLVVYWAVKAEPEPPEPVVRRVAADRARPEAARGADRPQAAPAARAPDAPPRAARRARCTR